ncbi:hypothetical protein [Fusobacterium polymorphum]|uniref:hypothetical protein n=1 Tax=Fusobacterium nucleatum subsp. polymorphum TaxID=76857 RepID=UPI00300948CD
MKYKIIETVKISMIMTTILNFFICIVTELRYIEFIYLLLFLGINLYMIGVKGYFKIETYNYSLYTIRKKIVDSQRATILSINILIFFYIFKEPYFFLSKYKILILFISIIVGYLTLIFIQKIKIRISLNFFKEIIKIFLVSGIIYYFPIVCTYILLKII